MNPRPKSRTHRLKLALLAVVLAAGVLPCLGGCDLSMLYADPYDPRDPAFWPILPPDYVDLNAQE